MSGIALSALVRVLFLYLLSLLYDSSRRHGEEKSPCSPCLRPYPRQQHCRGGYPQFQLPTFLFGRRSGSNSDEETTLMLLKAIASAASTG